MLTRALPRLAPRAIRRLRLERRLANDLSLPVRFVVAPPGSGKTTLLLHYLSTVPRAAYCRVPEHASAHALVESASIALGAPPAASFSEFLASLEEAAREPLELAFDDVQHAGPDAVQLLTRLVDEAPHSVSFMFGSQSRSAANAKEFVSRGIAAFIDARRLMFDASDVAAHAASWNVSCSNRDIARLLEESDGWAVVVAGAIRLAAENERSLADAYSRWRERYGELFLGFVNAEAERAAPPDYARVQSLIAGGELDRDALLALESQGLFVINDNGTLRPFRSLAGVRTAPIRIDTSIPMVVRMLGRFSATIHNRDLTWVRKRDQQIVKFLLLRQGASATRAELAAAFWPRADKQLAAQSVRTACSNIRKAIASVVGYEKVDVYFHAGTTISIDLSNVVTDVGRFTAHAMAGDSCYAEGKYAEAIQHYQAAEKIYAGRLYDEDAEEAWFAKSARALEERLGLVLERLAEDAYNKGDLKHAAEYAYRAKLIFPEQPALLRLLSRLQGDRPSA